MHTLQVYFKLITLISLFLSFESMIITNKLGQSHHIQERILAGKSEILVCVDPLFSNITKQSIHYIVKGSIESLKEDYADEDFGKYLVEKDKEVFDKYMDEFETKKDGYIDNLNIQNNRRLYAYIRHDHPNNFMPAIINKKFIYNLAVTKLFVELNASVWDQEIFHQHHHKKIYKWKEMVDAQQQLKDPNDQNIKHYDHNDLQTYLLPAFWADNNNYLNEEYDKLEIAQQVEKLIWLGLQRYEFHFSQHQFNNFGGLFGQNNNNVFQNHNIAELIVNTGTVPADDANCSGFLVNVTENNNNNIISLTIESLTEGQQTVNHVLTAAHCVYSTQYLISPHQVMDNQAKDIYFRTLKELVDYQVQQDQNFLNNWGGEGITWTDNQNEPLQKAKCNAIDANDPYTRHLLANNRNNNFVANDFVLCRIVDGGNNDNPIDIQVNIAQGLTIDMTKANANYNYDHNTNPQTINLFGFPGIDINFQNRFPFLNLQLTNFNQINNNQLYQDNGLPNHDLILSNYNDATLNQKFDFLPDTNTSHKVLVYSGYPYGGMSGASSFSVIDGQNGTQTVQFEGILHSAFQDKTLLVRGFV